MGIPRPTVDLVSFTGKGSPEPAREAANILVFTKQTRLNMDLNAMERVQEMNDGEILGELSYMANTIPSSWEFVDYVFLINNVTRAFTHQFVRTRTGSYAQQTMRVLDVDGWTYGVGPTVEEDEDRAALYREAMENSARSYRKLIDEGAKIEDARGVLPTNIHTNIVAKFSLRTIAEIARKRASSRTQGEYREVLDLMIKEVVRVHPWASLFLERDFDRSAADLEAMVRYLIPSGKDQIKAIKLIDQMRASS